MSRWMKVDAVRKAQQELLRMVQLVMACGVEHEVAEALRFQIVMLLGR